MAQIKYNGEIVDKIYIANPGDIAGGGGGGGTITVPDGNDAAVGSKADAPVTDATMAASLLSLQKGQVALTSSSLGAKTPGTAATSAVLTGAVYNSSLPLANAGQQQALQTDSRGNLRTRMTGTQWTITDGINLNNVVGMNAENDATGATRALGVAPVMFNGTTLDRVRGTAADGLFVSAPARTSANISTTVTTTSSVIAAANSFAKLTLFNDSTATIWLNRGADAVATTAGNTGSFAFYPGDRMTIDRADGTESLTAIVASGTASLTVRRVT